MRPLYYQYCAMLMADSLPARTQEAFASPGSTEEATRMKVAPSGGLSKLWSLLGS